MSFLITVLNTETRRIWYELRATEDECDELVDSIYSNRGDDARIVVTSEELPNEAPPDAIE